MELENKPFDPSDREWIRVGDDRKPLKGSTVIAFTPIWGSLRFRVVGEDLLHTLSEATHWSPLTENGDQRSLVAAAFSAGQAWAYYKAGDMIPAPKTKGSKTSEVSGQ